MNPPIFDWTTFFHAGYVAFVFGVLFFGALAFRQVLDNLDVRRLSMGEDRDSFVDAAGGIAAGAILVFLLVLMIVWYGILRPSVYVYAIPLVLGVQWLQITLRLIFQRTLVRTRGLVVRSVLFDKVRAIPYADIVMVRFIKGKLWTDVRIGLPNEEVGFRIFSFSADQLERLIQGATAAPILWSSASVVEHL